MEHNALEGFFLACYHIKLQFILLCFIVNFIQMQNGPFLQQIIFISYITTNMN